MANKLQKAIQIVLIVLFIVFGVYRVLQANFQKERNLIYTLEQYANDMNSECPIAVGSSDELIIQKVYFIKTKTIVYEYRMLNYSKDTLDVKQMKKNLSDPIIEELELMKSLAILRNNNVIFEYRYFDNQNAELFRLKALFNTPIIFID